ncbi:MAG: hypothetical protein GTN70_00815 [Deltaproteobacteria bacterium]|nr:hypothetical protein [Deltaproteobacteria bacterium]NIS76196.1 hypothetical protein [Deltaproteobacteria bacterium]
MEKYKNRRRETRVKAAVAAFLIAVSGKDEAIKSPRQKVKVKDISPLGTRIESPSVRPGGIHVMYSDLMLHKNTVELHFDAAGEEEVVIKGKVIWYDKPEGMTDYVIGIEFDEARDISQLVDEES